MEFERHNVLLAEPIKELGDYSIVAKLTKNVSATVTVSVVGEDGTTAADIKAKASGGAKAKAPTEAEGEEAEPDADADAELEDEPAAEDE
jgi:hypothetical protein